jgi:hypothetical protein
MNDHRFTQRLIRYTLMFLVSLGACFLLRWMRGFFPVNTMHASALQLVADTAFGLLRLAVLITTIMYGLWVFSLLLQAYEAGAKVLNGNDHRNDL